MAFKLFGGDSDGDDTVSRNQDYVEVNSFSEEPETKLMSTGTSKIGIRVDKLNDFEDSDRILKSLRSGNIVFLKIKGLKEKDMGELKRAVDKLKKTAMANNGDIAGVEQDWLILTPSHANVMRE
ncbi:MAG: cell division protein SepF [Candidatus Aenigmarchaeota archaeon]|nr:cell division protein SepF [Candidatus Aenigmarchaeota archaeon]